MQAQRVLVSEQKSREIRSDAQQSLNQQSEDAEEAAAMRAAGMNRFLMSGNTNFSIHSVSLFVFLVCMRERERERRKR